MEKKKNTSDLTSSATGLPQLHVMLPNLPLFGEIVRCVRSSPASFTQHSPNDERHQHRRQSRYAANSCPGTETRQLTPSPDVCPFCYPCQHGRLHHQPSRLPLNSHPARLRLPLPRGPSLQHPIQPIDQVLLRQILGLHVLASPFALFAMSPTLWLTYVNSYRVHSPIRHCW